jgi:ribonuclease R
MPRPKRLSRSARRHASAQVVAREAGREFVDELRPAAGLVTRSGKHLEVEPLFQKGTSLLVAREGVKPNPGDLVLYTYSHGRRVRILKVIGHKGDVRDVLEALLLDSVPHRGFTPRVLAEAAEVGKHHAVRDEGRVDLRRLFTFTIDPETARDFDDALSFERVDEDAVRVYVHIADVSYFVREGSVIDQEALRRANSVYVPTGVEPMLPPQLSSGVCSLSPGAERKTVTVEMVVDREGHVQSADFYRSLICSDERLEYQQVQDMFEGRVQPASDLAAALDLGRSVATALRQRRAERGKIAITSFEPDFHWDHQGHLVRAHIAQDLESHLFIEDFMVLANEQVAAFLERRQMPTVYRVHDLPDPFHLDHLLDVLASLDLPTPPFDPVTATPTDIRRTTVEVAGWVERITPPGRGKAALMNQVLRAQSRAVYQTKNIGHFGLASTAYCHFTSPIRRYPDLLVHRGLLAELGLGPKPTTVSLSDWAAHCSRMEREAAKVELLADDIALAHLLAARLERGGRGQLFSGEILSLVRSGAFVLFDGLYQGFLAARDLPGDYYELNDMETALVGRRTGTAYRLADLLTVRVKGIDEARGKIDVEPAGE